MLVKNWMSKNVVTVAKNDSMETATRLLKENNIRMLPVMKKSKLVGVLTDRDLKKASASDATSLEIHELRYLLARIKVGEIMTADPITVPYDFTIEETAEILLKHKISGLPVLDHKAQLVGVVTQSDIFKALVSLSGLSKRGISFAFMLEDRPGSIKEVTDIIRSSGGRIASILSSYDRVPEGHRKVFIRMYDVERRMLPALQEKLYQKASLLYIVDHRENKREIFQL